MASSAQSGAQLFARPSSQSDALLGARLFALLDALPGVLLRARLFALLGSLLGARLFALLDALLWCPAPFPARCPARCPAGLSLPPPPAERLRGRRGPGRLFGAARRGRRQAGARCHRRVPGPPPPDIGWKLEQRGGDGRCRSIAARAAPHGAAPARHRTAPAPRCARSPRARHRAGGEGRSRSRGCAASAGRTRLGGRGTPGVLPGDAAQSPCPCEPVGRGQAASAPYPNPGPPLRPPRCFLLLLKGAAGTCHLRSLPASSGAASVLPTGPAPRPARCSCPHGQRWISRAGDAVLGAQQRRTRQRHLACLGLGNTAGSCAVDDRPRCWSSESHFFRERR
ncbi:serine/arginine repetitive matrix protein 3-like [Prinia subflava]|uniref:serine/arginine repetitive matrix protein 3-like n=1 Tax=Prinia subflava TaxID=208062 RepID=UPI002FE0C170